MTAMMMTMETKATAATCGGKGDPSVTPIWPHYDTNNALLGIFAFNGDVCLAYAVRRRFVEVTLYRIPRHGNYTSGSEG